MNRTIAALAAFLTLLATAAAHAQSTAPARQFLIGADGTIALPLGNLSNVSGIGIGAMLTGEYLFQDQITFTGRIGYEFHLDSNSAHVNVLPVMVGARYYIAQPSKHQGMFGLGEVGFNDLMTSVNVPGFGSASNSSIYLGLGVGAGYQMGPIDFQAKLQFLDIGHPGDTFEIAVLAGYQFAAF
jgi:hypothetical protein